MPNELNGKQETESMVLPSNDRQLREDVGLRSQS
jgi:hypothetical protein